MTKPMLHVDHPRPVTRRQFLAQGLIQSSALVMMPTILSQLLGSQTALAANCTAAANSSLLPFLVFDCAGGAALAGNWLVGKQGGPTDFISSYDKMGVPTTPQNGEPIDSQFGVPMFTNLSKIREGIVAQTSPEARANLRIGTLCTASQDDTGANELSALLLASSAFGAGQFLRTGLGTRASLSGGNSKGPGSNTSMRPLRVGSVTSVLGALSYGPAIDPLSVNQKAALTKALARLSGSQADKLLGMENGEQLKALVECGLLENQAYINASTAASQVDPRLDPACQAVFGITAASTGAVTTIPTIAYNVLKKNTGPGAITFGGCDYHDGTQTTGDAKDLEIGTAIGQCVELAHRLGTALVFAVVSDGSVYSDPGTRIWRGDAGSQGLLAVGFFNPVGPPPMRRLQVGHFKEGQGVERSTYIGNSPKLAAYAVFANYLAASGNIGLFTSFVQNNEFQASQIDAHLLFG